ncbi:MAG: proline--tRNA ligase, partial [Myxococcales bacterium]|nr:proline--tRNA ligase [Myxococcales bacterium]
LMYVSVIGDDHLLLCDGCGYAANREVADYRVPADDGEARPYEKVATPGAATIAELAAFLGIDARQTAKVVLYWATRADPAVPDGLVMAVVRGDTDANDVAVGRAAGASALRAATTDEITAAGVVPGYASPIGADRSRVTVVVDALVEASPALVAGANDAGFHLLNTRCGRDYTPDHVGVVALAPEGALCAVCGATLRTARGVEVGNVFQLGTRYTDAVGATWLDEHGRAQPIVMGSYGIGVGRLLACVAEEHHDASGLCLPIAVAPFPVALVAMARKPGTQERADALYAELRSAGVEVLYDDRPKLSPGVKLAEADLRGMPLRVVVSDRGLAEGHVELKRRAGGEPWSVPLDAAVDAIRAELVSLRA